MNLSDLSVHVATITKKVGDKVYRSHLLRHSFREDGRVQNRTVANLSMLPVRRHQKLTPWRHEN